MIQRSGSLSAKGILSDMTGIGRFCFIWHSTDMKQPYSFQSSLWVVLCFKTTSIPYQPCWSPNTAPTPPIPRTQTHSSPAFRKAWLTLIGCTDPFLWIWIKVRQATHAKLCQAGPHAHTSSHRVTKRWEGEEEEGEGRNSWKDGGTE